MVTNKGKHAQTLKKHGEILEKIAKKNFTDTKIAYKSEEIHQF